MADPIQVINWITGAPTALSVLLLVEQAPATLLVYASTSVIASDFSTLTNARITLTKNSTLAAPANATQGQEGNIVIVQDSVGSRTLSYNSGWVFPGGTPPTLSTGAGDVDILTYYVINVVASVGPTVAGNLTKNYA